MASSAASIESEGTHQSAETGFQAKTAWVLIRGNRYQVLEEEFFKFILKPHDEALRGASVQYAFAQAELRTAEDLSNMPENLGRARRPLLRWAARCSSSA